jgi:hypothetical protein
MSQSRRRRIDETLERINTFKIQKIMEFCNWSYHDTDVPPPEQRIKDVVRRLLQKIMTEDTSCVGTGGIAVREDETGYEINFIAESDFITATSDDNHWSNKEENNET